MHKTRILFAIVILICSLQITNSYGQVKILFDATKAEMAGNADWVIDADLANLYVGSSGVHVSGSGTKSNPQRIPTPAQSGITAATGDYYWKGGLSGWAVDCVNSGYTVETLPYNGSITYGDTSNPQDLSNYKVFVIDEPNIVFSTAEKTALMHFVQNGGGLFMISDHDGSDRNSDGWDSPAIWNDFINNNSVAPHPFGFVFDLTDISGSSSNLSAAATDSIIYGPAGSVSHVLWANGTTMTLNPADNASVKGVIYETGTTPGNTNAMVAYARYGAGKVAAMGDSSPADDGSGNPGCTLYNGYFADAGGNHRKLIMNMTIWLAGTMPAGIDEVDASNPMANVYPNPSSGVINISTDGLLFNTSINIYNFAGQLVATQSVAKLGQGSVASFTLTPGVYIARIQNSKGLQTSRVTVY